MDLYETFEQIKKRPGMFLGHVSIKNFFMFYHGYSFARRDLKITATEQESEFYGFQEWIQKKHNVIPFMGWHNFAQL